MKTYGRKSINNHDESLTKDIPCPLLKRTKITDFFFSQIDVDENDIIKTTRSKKIMKNNPTMKQTFLDLGQKNLFMIECKECGMSYDRSFTEDVKRHQIEHQRIDSIFCIERYEKYSIWNEYFDRGSSLTGGGLVVYKFSGRENVRILQDLIERVNEQMGAVSQTIEEMKKLTIYLCINKKKRIIGLLSTEEITESFILELNDGFTTKQKCNTTNIGISRIWIDSKNRRNGIGLLLLRSIRSCSHQNAIQCSPSCNISPDKVAFSQPTEAGKQLAMKYGGNDQIRVYM